MEPYVLYVIIYFALLSILGFSLMRHDKQLARRRGRLRRIPENTLMFVAFAGGALGAWIGMYAYRHKTKHRAFVIGVPLLLLWNAFVVLFLLDQLPAGWMD